MVDLRVIYVDKLVYIVPPTPIAGPVVLLLWVYSPSSFLI